MNKKTHIADLTTCFFHTSADNQKKKKKTIPFLFWTSCLYQKHFITHQ